MMPKSLNIWIFLLSISIVSGAFAYPLDPEERRTVDNDGDSLTLQDLGDEHYSVTRTEDGFLVVADKKGTFYYANENGEISRHKAKNAKKRSTAEKNFLKSLDRNRTYRAHHQKNQESAIDDSEESRAPWVPTAQPKQSTPTSSLYMRLPKPSHSEGTNRFPVILVEGDGRTNMDSATIYAELNEEGYTDNSYLGSVRDYFVDQSSGIFVPIFDVFLVTESEPFASFIGSEAQMMNRAIHSMLEKYPSFDVTQYDSDNDGFVDAFAVLYAGERVNSEDKHLGGFQTTLGKYNAIVKSDGKIFNNCFIIEQNKKSHIVQFIHEFSHTMGLKDHYCVRANDCKVDFSDSAYQAPGAHAWDVMATGMYNGNSRKPPNYSAFERNFMGWLQYTPLEDEFTINTLPPLGTSNFAYHIEVDQDEWYVFENRQLVKWDSGLPNHGMLVWHIEYDKNDWNKDVMNDSAKHQRVDIIEAGDIRVISHSKGYMSQSLGLNQVDDPFPGSQDVTELSPVLAWSGDIVLDGLFNIVEKDTNVCFSLHQDVTTDECGAIRSSSSIKTESSSSAESSSSEEPTSSSSDESSSSAEPESSSSNSSTIVWRGSTPLQAIHVSQRGQTLDIRISREGLKTVRVFDVQGHALASDSFTGTSHQMRLGKIARGTPLVVRIENGRSSATLLTK